MGYGWQWVGEGEARQVMAGAFEWAKAQPGNGPPRLRRRLRVRPRPRLLGRADRAARSERARRRQHPPRHLHQRSRLRRFPDRQLQASLGASGGDRGPDRAVAMAYPGRGLCRRSYRWHGRARSRPQGLLANPRYQPVPVGSDAYPWKEAFPSGHSAGSLAWLLAFLSVVPISWRRPTAIAGVVFTLYISFGVLVLNYHYPSDVLGGWLLAAGWWFALLALWKRGQEDRGLPPPA